MDAVTPPYVTTGTITSALQTYFNPKLVDRILKNTVLDQFTTKAPLPAKAGKKSVTFFRFGAPSVSDIDSIVSSPVDTSGVVYEGGATGAAATSTYYWTPAKMKKLSVTSAEITLSQYGEVIGVTDIASAESLFNLIEQAQLKLTGDMALKFDNIIGNALNADTSSGHLGTTVARNTFCVSSGANTWDNYRTGSGGSSKDTVFALSALLDSATALRIQSAPTFSGGYYTAVCAPQIVREIVGTATSTSVNTWWDLNKYSNAETIYRGEVGRIYGCKVIETNNPYTIATDGADAAAQFVYAAAGTTYVTFVLGNASAGVPDLASQSPYAPSISVVEGADKADPLNQLTTVGFKAFLGAKLLQPEWTARIYSTATYS